MTSFDASPARTRPACARSFPAISADARATSESSRRCDPCSPLPCHPRDRSHRLDGGPDRPGPRDGRAIDDTGDRSPHSAVGIRLRRRRPGPVASLAGRARSLRCILTGATKPDRRAEIAGCGEFGSGEQGCRRRLTAPDADTPCVRRVEHRRIRLRDGPCGRTGLSMACSQGHPDRGALSAGGVACGPPARRPPGSRNECRHWTHESKIRRQRARHLR